MPRGYHLPEPSDVADPWAGFEWDLPAEYNVAAECLDAGDSADEALRHVGVDGERTALTYGELRAATDATAARFATAGVDPGDRVGLCLPQSPELLVAHLATFAVGAVSVPLSMLLGDASLRSTAARADVSLVVCDAQRRAALDGEFAAESLVVETGARTAPLFGLDAHVTAGDTVDRPATTPDDPALVLFTSGSTGDPKGVVVGHSYLAGSLPGNQCWYQLFDAAEARAARIYTPAEWAWAGALFDVVFPTLALGGTVVSHERRSGFDPDRALGLIASEGVTHAYFPPTALRRMRAEVDPAAHDLSALVAVQSGGEALPDGVQSWAERALGAVINEGYGQTEANAIAGECRAAYPPRDGSLGRPYPGHDVVVVDEDGAELPPGEVGELVVRPPDPVLFSGYLDDPAATDAAFTDEGWLRTGDAVERDADGYLYHRGRLDDVIITSGYRVSPTEVEDALSTHPAVAAAVVGGVPDADRGQRVVACVVPADDATADDDLAATLTATVADAIGPHKRPREVRFLDAIPETRNGKADRAALFGEE
ncbi:MAG: acyl-CoA synthetase [Halobacteriaceae archaeon]